MKELYFKVLIAEKIDLPLSTAEIRQNPTFEMYLAQYHEKLINVMYKPANGFNENQFVQLITRKLNTEDYLLTHRELECLLLTSQGKSAKEVANELFLSAETVNTHLKSARKKMNCKTTAQSVAMAIKKDLFKSLISPNLGIL